jgi:hypothetical protein
VAADVVRRRLLPVFAGAVLLGVLAAPAGAQTLYGSIQGGEIDVKDATGTRVTTIQPGSYTFEVADTERIHNFHLIGTAVRTPVDESVGLFTFLNVALAEGTYVYRCDVHPEVNRSFAVAATAPPAPPPAGAPARVTGVRAVVARAGRRVVVSLAVTRPASAVAQLRKKGKRVAGVRARLVPGKRRIGIAVPARLRAGRYLVSVKIAEAGAVYPFTRTVRIPRAST